MRNTVTFDFTIWQRIILEADRRFENTSPTGLFVNSLLDRDVMMYWVEKISQIPHNEDTFMEVRNALYFEYDSQCRAMMSMIRLNKYVTKTLPNMFSHTFSRIDWSKAARFIMWVTNYMLSHSDEVEKWETEQ